MTEIASPVTGTVLDVLVALHDAVEPGQTLLILESMKMEFPIEATVGGVVAAVAVVAGAAVAPGQTLVTIR